MRAAKFLDIIKSFGGYLRVDNLAGYKEDYVLDDLGDNDFPTKAMLVSYVPTPDPVVYNVPAESETPIIINFEDSSIKIGSASPVSIGASLAAFAKNPEIKFEIITSSNNTTPKDPAAWIVNKEWASAYASLVELTLVPDTDTGLSGGVTLDNINIIIKP